MALLKNDFLLDVWTVDSEGNKLHPYKGEKGLKKGLFSVNFTNDTNKFEGYTEAQLIDAIVKGKFKTKGTIRMLPLNYKAGMDRNAFSPKLYLGKSIKSYG